MRLFHFPQSKKQQSGFLLPVAIILAVAISILGVTVMQVTSSTSSTLNNQYYRTIADEAAQAGISYAIGCLTDDPSATWTQLTPDSTCSGTVGSGNDFVIQKDNWKSVFTVSAPVATSLVTTVSSKGEVLLLKANGDIAQRIEVTVKKTLLPKTSTIPISSGKTVTDITTDSSNCAIANGELYCWGRNDFGELGIGNQVDQSTPQRVAGASGQAFYNKRVTAVSMGTYHACAIADGALYCWGSNWFGLFNPGKLSTACTTEFCTTPQLVAGALSGKRVTKVVASQGSINSYTCAIADGITYCWGDGSVQQLGQINYANIPFIGCTPNLLIPNSDNRSTPTPAYGYNTSSGKCDSDSELYGKKSLDLAAGLGQVCALANGGLYCWGGHNPADVSGDPQPKTGSLTNKIALPGTLNGAGGTTCASSGGALHCTGLQMGLCGLTCVNPAQYYNGNVTSGDSSSDLGALYCLVDNGTPKCAGDDGTGTDSTGGTQKPLIGFGTNNKIATKIGAGNSGGIQGMGCVIWNGSLACWGYGQLGQLGNGQMTATSTQPTTVLGGIGTADGTAAATDVSTGGTHACGVANGQAYCWGNNANGQLGTGDLLPRSTPFSPINSVGKVASKISAGYQHTCMIADAQLYCWGNNANGQLGLSSLTTQNTPQQVPTFIGKVVTEVSAGKTTTCAVADGLLYCWGDNTNRQLGRGASTATQETAPVLVNGGSNVLGGKAITSITAGNTHTCAVANGSAYCWGANASGQTGLNTTSGISGNPTLLTGGTMGATAGNLTAHVTQITAGNGFSCAIVNGAVSCWGTSTSGQTGSGTTQRTVPTAITGDAANLLVTSVSAGDNNACAVAIGRTYCWGTNASGQIGDGGSTNVTSSKLINNSILAANTSTQVSVGASTSCNIANAVIQCWGLGTNGQIGNNSLTSVSVPTSTSDYTLFVPLGEGITY